MLCFWFFSAFCSRIIVRKTASGAIFSSLLVCVVSTARAQLNFDFTHSPTMDPDAVSGFQAAANLWSGHFTDTMTVNIDIGFTALAPNILGSAGSTTFTDSYSDWKNALVSESVSAADAIATANLPVESAFGVYINRTTDNPFGDGSATPYVDNDGDANNTSIRMTSANAKAVGLLGPTDAGNDASITFSTLFDWDFDPSDGITSGAFDFIGVAAHGPAVRISSPEQGHRLPGLNGPISFDGST